MPTARPSSVNGHGSALERQRPRPMLAAPDGLRTNAQGTITPKPSLYAMDFTPSWRLASNRSVATEVPRPVSSSPRRSTSAVRPGGLAVAVNRTVSLFLGRRCERRGEPIRSRL